MSSLYLRCGICGRQQANGILSRVSWGHVVRADQSNASACPTCKETHSDWENRLHAGDSQSQHGSSFSQTA